MPNKLDKYFWDSPAETFSKEFRLQRLLEYASFPDLFAIPFEHFKTALPHVSLDQQRIPAARRRLFKELLPYVTTSSSLSQAIRSYIADAFKSKGYSFKD